MRLVRGTCSWCGELGHDKRSCDVSTSTRVHAASAAITATTSGTVRASSGGRTENQPRHGFGVRAFMHRHEHSGSRSAGGAAADLKEHDGEGTQDCGACADRTRDPRRTGFRRSYMAVSDIWAESVARVPLTPHESELNTRNVPRGSTNWLFASSDFVAAGWLRKNPSLSGEWAITPNGVAAVEAFPGNEPCRRSPALRRSLKETVDATRSSVHCPNAG